jgi:hypothetical protein
MTLLEQLFLGIVVAEFAIFAVTLATVAWRTERFLRRKAAEDMPQAADQPAYRHAA